MDKTIKVTALIGGLIFSICTLFMVVEIVRRFFEFSEICPFPIAIIGDGISCAFLAISMFFCNLQSARENKQ